MTIMHHPKGTHLLDSIQLVTQIGFPPQGKFLCTDQAFVVCLLRYYLFGKEDPPIFRAPHPYARPRRLRTRRRRTAPAVQKGRRRPLQFLKEPTFQLRFRCVLFPSVGFKWDLSLLDCFIFFPEDLSKRRQPKRVLPCKLRWHPKRRLKGDSSRTGFVFSVSSVAETTVIHVLPLSWQAQPFARLAEIGGNWSGRPLQLYGRLLAWARFQLPKRRPELCLGESCGK